MEDEEEGYVTLVLEECYKTINPTFPFTQDNRENLKRLGNFMDVDGWTGASIVNDKIVLEKTLTLPLNLRCSSTLLYGVLKKPFIKKTLSLNKDLPRSFRLCSFQEVGVQTLVQWDSLPLSHRIGIPVNDQVFGVFPNGHEVFCTRMVDSRRGGFLCDSPGLGKTVQSIEAINRLDASTPNKSSNLRGGTLILCTAGLQNQWLTEVEDKCVVSSAVIWGDDVRTKEAMEIGACPIIIMSYAMLRSERRRHRDLAIEGSSWECSSFRVEEVEEHRETTRLEEIQRLDIVRIEAWRTNFVCLSISLEEGVMSGAVWSTSLSTCLDTLSTVQVDLKKNSWSVIHHLVFCSHRNEVEKDVKISSLFCSVCGAPPSPALFPSLQSKVLPLLFNVDWTRIIIDESDHLAGMTQTYEDVRMLHTDRLWCLTGTPNGPEATFGQTFLKQLLLFFPSFESVDDLGVWLREMRDPAFHEDFVNAWMVKRTKEQVKEELALPKVLFHRIPINLQDQDAGDIVIQSHQRVKQILSKEVRIRSRSLFDRLLRLLTTQPHMEAHAITDDMGLLHSLSHEDVPSTPCPICKEAIKDVTDSSIKTPCGHSFCYDCLQAWVLRTFDSVPTCPLCRAVLDLGSLRLHFPLDSCRGNRSKVRWIQSLISKIQTRNEKAVIVVRFVEAADFLGRCLGIPWIHGKLSKEKRTSLLNLFSSPKTEFKYPAIILTMRTGMLGLNLAMASHLVIVDLPPKSFIEVQLISRLHRIGQTRPVHVYHLVTLGTIEEVVHDNPGSSWSTLMKDYTSPPSHIVNKPI